jgi:hypothetical protein
MFFGFFSVPGSVGWRLDPFCLCCRCPNMENLSVHTARISKIILHYGKGWLWLWPGRKNSHSLHTEGLRPCSLFDYSVVLSSSRFIRRPSERATSRVSSSEGIESSSIIIVTHADIVCSAPRRRVHMSLKVVPTTSRTSINIICSTLTSRGNGGINFPLFPPQINPVFTDAAPSPSRSVARRRVSGRRLLKHRSENPEYTKSH